MASAGPFVQGGEGIAPGAARPGRRRIKGSRRPLLQPRQLAHVHGQDQQAGHQNRPDSPLRSGEEPGRHSDKNQQQREDEQIGPDHDDSAESR
jgi:hypothetical protein